MVIHLSGRKAYFGESGYLGFEGKGGRTWGGKEWPDEGVRTVFTFTFTFFSSEYREGRW